MQIENIEEMKKRYSILITSCDTYCDLWSNLEFLYNRFWPNHSQIYLFAENNKNSFPKSFRFISSNSNFSFRIRSALNEIESEYVFIACDDYFLKKDVDEKRFAELIDFMSTNEIDYLRLFNYPNVGKKVAKKIRELPLTDIYEVNFYPGIWKVESLKRIILKDENPWQFEVKLTSRSKKEGFKCFACSDMSIFPFVDIVRKGKYLRSGYRFLKNNNLYISSRKKRTIIETIKLNARIMVGRIMPKVLLRAYRKSKFNHHFSSYEYSSDE